MVRSVLSVRESMVRMAPSFLFSTAAISAQCKPAVKRSSNTNDLVASDCPEPCSLLILEHSFEFSLVFKG
jgi:hypothetical protein